MIIYGSYLCGDCNNLKYNLDKNNVEYTYIDITSSIADLKAFLKIRDNSQLFDDVKKNGGIGIPFIVDNDYKTLNWEEYLRNLGYNDIEYIETKTVCDIRNHNC